MNTESTTVNSNPIISIPYQMYEGYINGSLWDQEPYKSIIQAATNNPNGAIVPEFPECSRFPDYDELDERIKNIEEEIVALQHKVDALMNAFLFDGKTTKSTK